MGRESYGQGTRSAVQERDLRQLSELADTYDLINVLSQGQGSMSMAF